MQLGQHIGRFRIEPVQEAEPPEQDFRELGRLCLGKRTRGFNVVDSLDVHMLNADRRRASGEGQGEGQSPPQGGYTPSPPREKYRGHLFFES